MKEVVCWCCEYFIPIYGESNITIGRCAKFSAIRSTEACVCEKFLLRSGLFTKRTIPNICKNYNNKPQ